MYHKQNLILKHTAPLRAIAIDEPGDAQHSLVPDSDDDGVHDNARQNALWGGIMAGGWASEWYFGYAHDNSDLSCQDFRSRDKFWDQCRYQVDFFRTVHLPLAEMKPTNDLTSATEDWVLAKEGVVYLIFLKMGNKSSNVLTTPGGTYSSEWFNPRNGKWTDKKIIEQGDEIIIGPPPFEVDKDWLVIVRREK